MKEYNKLVRDKIPEIIKEDGFEPQVRILSDQEYKLELLKKLVEEANEVLETNGEGVEVEKELADVLQVVDDLIPACGLDQQTVAQTKAERKEKRGGFEKRIFLESTNE